jgi:hypothetical protein
MAKSEYAKYIITDTGPESRVREKIIRRVDRPIFHFSTGHTAKYS